MSEKTKLLFNRIGFLVLGGLLMFAIISTTTMNTLKSENGTLLSELNKVQFEPTSLLDAAKVHLLAKDYEKAHASLELLFSNHPGSAESVEGRRLETALNSEEKVTAELWEAALPEIRQDWVGVYETKLRDDANAARVKEESLIPGKVLQEWEKALPAIKTEWLLSL